MTVNKSIIDIQVMDDSFKAFSEQFSKYQQSVRDMPSEWAKVNIKHKEAKGFLAGFLASLVAVKETTGGIAEKQKAANTAAATSSTYWKNMALSAKDFAGSITRATTSLLKWGALTGLVSGLIGGGGLFGFDRLAVDVSNKRRTALGQGTTYGEQNAFGISFGDLVNPGAFLGSVNQARHSLNNRAGFFGAQMTGADLQGDTAAVSINLLKHLKTIADKTDPRNLEGVMQARGLDQFVTLEEFQQIQSMTAQEFTNYLNRYGANSKLMDLDRNTQDAYQSFTQQMKSAGGRIENVFVKGLVKLEGPLEDLSEGIVRFIEAVADSPQIKEWITELTTWIKGFTDNLKKDDFKEIGTYAHETVAGLKTLATGLGWIARRFGWTDTDKAAPAYSSDTLEKNSDLYDSFKQLERNTGRIPLGLLAATYAQESASGTLLGHPTGDDPRGPMQMRPSTFNQYKQSPAASIDDAADAAAAAANYYAYLIPHYKGNLAKAEAAYNWGPGNVDKAGDAWLQKAPNETLKYIIDMQNRMAVIRNNDNDYSGVGAASAGTGTFSRADMNALVNAVINSQRTGLKVNIENNSGGSAIASAIQIAQ